MSAVTIVIIIFVVIILFTYFYHMYKSWKKNEKKYQWPPEVLPCPDYWIHKGNGVCENTFGLGLGASQNTKGYPLQSKTFSTMPGCDKPNSKTCLNQKRQWANLTQNPWFGIAPQCHENPANCYVPS